MRSAGLELTLSWYERKAPHQKMPPSGVGMAGRGSPAKSAGSARPKFFFCIFGIYVSNYVVIHRSEVPARNLISAGPAGQRTSSWESSRPYPADLIGVAGPAGHINLGRQVSGRVRPQVGPGRPLVTRPEEVAGGGRCRPKPAEAGRHRPKVAGVGR